MKILHLSLKEKWYRKIESGEKKEEYREITPYWVKRLTDTDNFLDAKHIPFRHYDAVEFSLGYPKKENTSRRMTFEIASIGIGVGNTKWGAPTDKAVFIIKLGERTDDK